jgi:hypothetical protein
MNSLDIHIRLLYPNPYAFLVAKTNAKIPRIPANRDEIKIMSFELSIVLESLNANKVTKIDMVNPIPPRKETDISCFQFDPLGSLQIPILTKINVNRTIPIGFPKTSPKKMPSVEFDEKKSPQFGLITMAVLAIANKGSMTNGTGLSSQSCRIPAGDFDSSFVAGIVNASKTPLIVA